MKFAEFLAVPRLCLLFLPLTSRLLPLRRLMLPSSPTMDFNSPPPNPSANRPGMLRRAWNLVEAVAAFVADDCQTVSAEEYAARLAICDACDSRKGNVCEACGCILSIKARGQAMTCPLQRWPPINSTPENPT